MATKVSWNDFDYAAKQVLSDLMDEAEISYREMENLTHGEVTYNRIRDIRLGRRAPVRLSEFILLCDVNHCTPMQGLAKVFDVIRADEQAEHDEIDEKDRLDALDAFDDAVDHEDPDDSDDKTDALEYRAMHVTELGLAAKQGDIEAEQEAYEEMP
jgi:hypothetical protein